MAVSGEYLHFSWLYLGVHPTEEMGYTPSYIWNIPMDPTPGMHIQVLMIWVVLWKLYIYI